MKLTVNTEVPLTEREKALLRVLLQEKVTAPAEPEPAEAEPKPARKKPGPKPKAKEPEPKAKEPEPEPEEADDSPEGPTLDDAIAKATQLVSAGGRDTVRSALSEVGAKRVSELKEKDVPKFLAALDDA